MITTSEAPTGSDRALRVAILASVLVHLIAVLLALLANDGLQRLLAPGAAVRLPRKPQDEIVTISSAIRFERRPRPAPGQRRIPTHPPARPQVAVRPAAASRPVVPQVPRELREPPRAATVVEPTYAPPALLRHELAKTAPHAPAQAVRTAKSEASRPATSSGGRPSQVALGSGTRPARPQRAAPHVAFSREQLAQIERDLARTIAQARANANPIRNIPREPPAAPKHYRIQMEGKFASLRRGQGTYSPIKAWRANGLDYYYVSYEFLWADGTYESGTVPWPIHFEPGVDPFARDDPSLVGRTPLPPPPPDYMPPGTLGKALRSYFPRLRFSDRDD